MFKKILLKRSQETLSDGKPKLPTADQVDVGEVAVNYAEGVEVFAIKNSNDEIVTFTNEVKIGNETPSDSLMAKLFINETNSSIQYHSSDGWKTIETGGESVNIAQTTGTSTTSVMSQNAVTTELNKKANTSHTHTASQVNGLATVATSGSYNDLSNKPTIPTVDSVLSSSSTNPVQNKVVNTALAGKANSRHVHAISDVTNLQTTLNGKANTTHTHTASQVSGLADVATSGSYNDLSNKPTIPSAYTLPVATSNTLGGVKIGVGLSIENDGTLNTTGGGIADSVAWDNITGKPSTFTPSEHTHAVVTDTKNGFMSSSDKEKLDSIATGATKTTVDSALSSSSTNPVQNKVINSALAGKASTSHTHTIANITNLQTTLNGKANTSHTHTALQVSGLADVATSGSYNDLTNKPSIPSQYELPIASTTKLGGVRVGDGLEINEDGILNCTIDPGSGTVSWGNIQGKPTFATVATSGSYNDLTNKPTIPPTITVDSALSSSSTNPVQNKVINSALAGKASTSHTHTASQVSGLSTVATSGSYNDLSNKPSIPSAYRLPQSTSSVLGGIKIGYTESGKNYPVELNSNGQAYVNVPWTDTNTTYNIATTSSNGLMSSTDKAKLDGIATGATKTTVDSTLSSSSTNPVQNKVINSALAGKANTSHTHTASQVSGLANVAKSGSYNDLTNKPTIPSAYTLPVATSNTLGGAKIGYPSMGLNRGVVLDSSQRMYVTLPGKPYRADFYVLDNSTDLDSFTENGLYSLYMGSLPTNLPSGYGTNQGTLEVFGPGACTVQRVTNVANRTWMRILNDATPGLVYQDWKEITGSSSGNYVQLNPSGGAMQTITGPLTATNFYESSDIRLKKNIETIDTSKSLKINYVKFTWKDSGKDSFGVIAQDIEEEIPEVVGKRTDNFRVVDYTMLHSMQIHALIQEIKALKEEITELKKKL